MKILIITLKDPNTHPRPYKQIMHLSKSHEVWVLGRKKILQPGVTSIENEYRTSYFNVLVFALLNILGMYETAYDFFFKSGSLKKFGPMLLEQQFDCIITHDIDTLPFAFRIRNNAKAHL